MSIQTILVYIVLFIALAYLVNKFLLPKKIRLGKKTSSACGQDDCGCH
ncbi:MAG: hypothetical protein KJO16_00465 [Muriicola sp.]|nr:hypothetical protein [Muriicola sp.]NNK12383.1 hypothetical protein [Flavobacteriaceae bacterium]